MAERLSYARPTRSSWPLKRGAMEDLPQLKESRRLPPGNMRWI